MERKCSHQKIPQTLLLRIYFCIYISIGFCHFLFEYFFQGSQHTLIRFFIIISSCFFREFFCYHSISSVMFPIDPFRFRNVFLSLVLFVEHLNILLFDLAKTYHTASKKVQINIASTTKSGRFVVDFLHLMIKQTNLHKKHCSMLAYV